MESNHKPILFAMVIGLIVGVVVNIAQPDIGGVGDFLAQLNAFIGDLFLRGLRFVAAPIVLFSLISGAGNLSDGATLGRLGVKTMALYLCTTAIAVALGLLFANLFQPGDYVSTEIRDMLAQQGQELANSKMSKAQPPSVWATLLNIIPKNPFTALAEGKMLQIVFFALAIGMGTTFLPQEKRRPILDFSDSMTDVLIHIVLLLMKLAPLAVFCLLAKVTASMGLEILQTLMVYSICVVAGLIVMVFGVYGSLIRFFTKMPFGEFLRGILPAQLLAFSSSSSSATMPVTLQCVNENLEVREEVSSFIVPLGATINMDGTALYQGVAALFIVQLYGIPVDFTDQLTIVLTATLASIGTAGVPGVGLIMLVVVLQGINVSPESMQGGLAIIFGVDRILDMCRTTCNVTGDCAVCLVVDQSEISSTENTQITEG